MKKLRISIYGVGRLGSQIAFCSLFLHPNIISLHDIKNLRGDIYDLKEAAKGLNIKTSITTKILKNPDFIIIAAGKARKKKLADDSFVADNYYTVHQIMHKIRPTRLTKFIILTNPVKMITYQLQKIFPGIYIRHTEEILAKYRNNLETDTVTLKTKGYTNFAPAVAAMEMMKNEIDKTTK